MIVEEREQVVAFRAGYIKGFTSYNDKIDIMQGKLNT